MPLLLRYDAVTTREISHFTLLAVLAFFFGSSTRSCGPQWRAKRAYPSLAVGSPHRLGTSLKQLGLFLIHHRTVERWHLLILWVPKKLCVIGDLKTSGSSLIVRLTKEKLCRYHLWGHVLLYLDWKETISKTCFVPPSTTGRRALCFSIGRRDPLMLNYHNQQPRWRNLSSWKRSGWPQNSMVMSWRILWILGCI